MSPTPCFAAESSRCRDLGVGFQHPEPRPVGHDLDVDVVLAEVDLDVARVVEREVPLRRVVVAHLQYHPVAILGLGCAGLRLGGGRSEREESADEGCRQCPGCEFRVHEFSSFCGVGRTGARLRAQFPRRANAGLYSPGSERRNNPVLRIRLPVRTMEIHLPFGRAPGLKARDRAIARHALPDRLRLDPRRGPGRRPRAVGDRKGASRFRPAARGTGAPGRGCSRSSPTACATTCARVASTSTWRASKTSWPRPTTRPKKRMRARNSRGACAPRWRGLPLGQRQVVTLVDLEECSYAQAGEILEIPIGTVMSRLCRARRALRELLEPLAGEAAGNKTAERQMSDEERISEEMLNAFVDGQLDAGSGRSLPRAWRTTRALREEVGRLRALKASVAPRLCGAARAREASPERAAALDGGRRRERRVRVRGLVRPRRVECAPRTRSGLGIRVAGRLARSAQGLALPRFLPRAGPRELRRARRVFRSARRSRRLPA